MTLRQQLQLAVAGAAALLVAACSEGPSPLVPTAPSAAAPQPAPPPAEPTARYQVTFAGAWTQGSHPQDFPSNPHFSRLVGGTHSASARFWAEGALASEGIKNMAERGQIQPLDQEVEAAIAAGAAQRVLIGGALGAGTGSVVLEFEMSQAYPLVTLVTMVAPSPDWFVGVTALPLFENGQWVDERRIELVPWDAGTDGGSTFTSPDLVTTPREPVSRIVSAPLSPGGQVTPLATFTFKRI